MNSSQDDEFLAQAERLAADLPPRRRCEFDEAMTRYLSVRGRLEGWARETCERHLLDLATAEDAPVSPYARSSKQVA